MARVLEAPLSLARVFAGQLAFGLAAVQLVPGISRVRFVPTAAVTTLSQTCRAHRLPSVQTQEEYDKRGKPTARSRATGNSSGRVQGYREEERKRSFWIKGDRRKRNFYPGRIRSLSDRRSQNV